MKEVKMYECSKCHNLYSTKDRAETCEDAHKEINKYEPEYEFPHPYYQLYPKAIKVTFDDGEVVEYEKKNKPISSDFEFVMNHRKD